MTPSGKTPMLGLNLGSNVQLDLPYFYGASFHSAAVSAAAIVSAGRLTIEVARFVKYRGSDWAATVVPIRKVVDHGFLPTAAGEAELENLSRV
jgi:hypothetical protein